MITSSLYLHALPYCSSAAPRSIPGHTSALIAVVTTIMTVGVCLLGTTLGVIIVRRFRLKTTQSNGTHNYVSSLI